MQHGCRKKERDDNEFLFFGYYDSADVQRMFSLLFGKRKKKSHCSIRFFFLYNKMQHIFI